MANRRKRKKVTWGTRLAQGMQAFFGEPGGDMGGAAGARGGSVAHIFDRSSEMMDVAEEVAAEQRGRVLILDRDGGHARWLLAQLRQQPPIPAFADVAREGFFTLVRLEPGDADADGALDSDLDGEAPEDVEAGALHGGANGYSGFGGGYGSYDGGYNGYNTAPRPDRPGGYAGYAWRGAYGDPAEPFERIEQEAVDADLIVFLFAGSDGWTEADARLYGRLRALSVPILPVAMFATAERSSEDSQAFLRRLRQWTGVEPTVLEMADWGATGDAQAAMDAGLRRLVDAMLALRPRLAVPLAQEVPFYRRAIATRIIRTGALMTGLLGAEPIPLLDLPLQVAVQWKVAMQLAAIYGRPGLDVRSREMVGTVGLNLTVRYVAQQFAKVVPGIGFLLSAALSGLSTVLLGRALLRVYEHDRLVDWEATKAALHAQGEHITAPLRNGVATGVAAVQQSTQRVAGYGATLGASIRQKVRRAPDAGAVADAADQDAAPDAETTDAAFTAAPDAGATDAAPDAGATDAAPGAGEPDAVSVADAADQDAAPDAGATDAAPGAREPDAAPDAASTADPNAAPVPEVQTEPAAPNLTIRDGEKEPDHADPLDAVDSLPAA
jgi:uncharacterized protein (DUF697 family)